MKYVFGNLFEIYGLYPKDCYKGKSGLFMSAMYENNKEDEYCDVTITFALMECGEIIKYTFILLCK